MRLLIIIRGPSGSGKTTLATKLGKFFNTDFCEADDFFVKDGRYAFDSMQLNKAHEFCRNKVWEKMLYDEEVIILSNTGMTSWELYPYINMAKDFGYEVKIYKTKGPWDAKLFASRNVHNVPLEVIERQIRRYQPQEGEIEYDE